MPHLYESMAIANRTPVRWSSCGSLLSFDATITLTDCHVALSGLTGPAAAVVVKRAVKRMLGATWTDVEVLPFRSHLPGWVIVYPAGCGGIPDTPAWRELRRTVEVTAAAALVAFGKPF